MSRVAVQTDALERTADRLRAVADGLRDASHGLHDVGAGEVGHAGLGDAVHDFTRRLTGGLVRLGEGTDSVAERLDGAAGTYDAVDEDIAAACRG